MLALWAKLCFRYSRQCCRDKNIVNFYFVLVSRVDFRFSFSLVDNNSKCLRHFHHRFHRHWRKTLVNVKLTTRIRNFSLTMLTSDRYSNHRLCNLRLSSVCNNGHLNFLHPFASWQCSGIGYPEGCSLPSWLWTMFPGTWQWQLCVHRWKVNGDFLYQKLLVLSSVNNLRCNRVMCFKPFIPFICFWDMVFARFLERTEWLTLEQSHPNTVVKAQKGQRKINR